MFLRSEAGPGARPHVEGVDIIDIVNNTTETHHPLLQLDALAVNQDDGSFEN